MKNKLLLIGASGTIGGYLADCWKERFDLIAAGRNGRDLQIDIENEKSVKQAFESVGQVDHIVCAAGSAPFKVFNELTEEDIKGGLNSKMMGQVRLVLNASICLNKRGSISLISGILAGDPVKGSSGIALANGGLNAFVKAASLEIVNDYRLNIISPGLVEASSEHLGDYFPGHIPVSMERVRVAYEKSVLGHVRGELIEAI